MTRDGQALAATPRSRVGRVRGLLSFLGLVLSWHLFLAPGLWSQEPLQLHFLDVGQGDAVLIQTPDARNVLYDGGERSRGVLRDLQELGIEELELVIASHNHADHIGGLIEVMDNLSVPLFMDNGIPHTTRTYEDLLVSVLEAGSRLLESTERTIRIGAVHLQIVPPTGDPGLGQNDNSIGVVVEYGDFRAFLGGDAEQRQWAWWLETHRDRLGSVHVLKSSHHGSRNGDTRDGLATLSPEVVVIGVGADNPYGHPHPSALRLYDEIGAEVFRTDRHHTIRIEALEDGTFEVFTERATASGPKLESGVIDVGPGLGW